MKKLARILPNLLPITAMVLFSLVNYRTGKVGAGPVLAALYSAVIPMGTLLWMLFQKTE